MFGAFGIVTLVMIIVAALTFHYNKIENQQIVQLPNGTVFVQRAAGFYIAFCAKISTYPKATLEYCSNNEKESKTKDAPQIQFRNTSTGWINCQIGYRIDLCDDDTFKRLHEWAHGDDEIIWQKVITKLQDCAQSEASVMNPTDAIEKYVDFVSGIRKRFIGNPDLKAIGIDIVTFDCSGKPGFDKKTETLFDAQLQANIMEKTAEAEKRKLVIEKERTVAQYEKEIAESKGKAEVEKMKQVTDAERQKELATIAAQQKVEVEKLQKEEMLVKAQKELEVAKIAKETESQQLEVIKIKAEQKVAEAEAKKKEIELSGAITEQERVRLEIEKDTKIGVAREIAMGIHSMTLPSVISLGGGASSGSDAISNLLNLLTAKNAQSILGGIGTINAQPVQAPKAK